MNQSIGSKHYKINASPLHMKKNPLNYQYVATRNPVPDSFQANLNLLHNNQMLYPRKPPGFNLSKSQDALPRHIKRPDASNSKILIKQVNNGLENGHILKDLKGLNSGIQAKNQTQMALKLPKIGTPEDQNRRVKANSVGIRTNKEKITKEKVPEKKNNLESNLEPKQIDFKKQKRLSDAGNIGFMIPPDSMEEMKKLQQYTVVKPHASSYSETVSNIKILY